MLSRRPEGSQQESLLSWRRKTVGRRRGRAEVPRRKPVVALLVDDMIDSRDMYGEILRYGGYRVLEAIDGADAVAVALGESPDVIVMDLCMPRVDGWEAIRRLKADPRTRSVPLVVLTGLGWGTGAAEVECEAYLVKPCLPFDLLSVLDALLGNATQA
jgi:two-component system, cell cycle response regulator DivK